MDIKNIILIIIAIFDVVVATILFFRNKRSPINISFATVLYFGGLWAIGIAMFGNTLDMETAVAWARMYYFASAVIVIAFLTFANYYPYKSAELEITKVIYFILPFLFTVFVIFHPSLLIQKATHLDWGNNANENLFGHLIFAIYFFSYLFIAYKILFKKLKGSDGINKRNLLIVIIATLAAFIIGSIFDLILPILGNYKLIWIGPNFTALVSLMLIYLIFL